MAHIDRTEMIAVARHRSDIYGLLAVLYRQEPTRDLLKRVRGPQFLEVMSQWGGELDDDFMTRPEDALLEEMAVEYTRLFLGPGKHVSPHESVHHEREDGQWGQLWGASTVEVRKFIEGTGLRYETKYRGLPDHIGVELEFLEALTRREEEAWEQDDEEGVRRCLDVERRFLDEHLFRWVAPFCDKVIAAAELSFYRSLASVTKRFIEFDRQECLRAES
ncbi:MAG: molecular chaperone TorD family protein [Desulfobacteraceae bacterium]|nr:molecular chaperone TorD family protein [Desulfobacteraceae bacterium]